jgi:hypothetical protein
MEPNAHQSTEAVVMKWLTASIATAAILLFAAAPAMASHRCLSTKYDWPVTASDAVSCPFAVSVFNTWVDDGGTGAYARGYWRHEVYSPVTHKTYTVSLLLGRQPHELAHYRVGERSRRVGQVLVRQLTR